MENRNTKALSEELRIQKLQEVMEKEKPVMTGVRIPYKGEEKEFKVYKIPLEYLVYNPYNGRIGTKVKTFEVNSHKVNPENENDIAIIEEYLWDSRPDRNKKTLNNLLKMKQKEYGIVSRNGFIIDGNRRASILNKIYREREKHSKFDVEHCKYFNAIILDDNADQKEILRLETIYQMGMDEKLEYNATEKYLKCKQLMEVGYQIDEIADMMGEANINTIKKNLEILDLMDQYLESYGYTDMYSMLEKREGQFVDLNSYTKAYETRSGNAKTNWSPSDSDISDMISINFDYIRAKYEGKEFRNIAQNGKSNTPKSIFAAEKLWCDFRDKHFGIVDEIEEEPISSYVDKTDLDGNVVDALADRDDIWTGKVIKSLKNNLRHSKSRLETLQQADKPLTLLDKAFSALNEIDDSQESLYTEDALSLISQIQKEAYELKKIIEKALKQNV